ncbi:MAG: hypothetical protein COU09_01480 [Candidatus Harrisonbacteria bacterium CG10_big_fil_rev_8_21_14_0_10_44_23]|uniref:ROK family protein n=1 Tax=Candidatus Harrisonbacteria bacterium CG10_big_fil_rev_8_21_14_0_10_44_23 TaxID=1974585 RepID=A0A2H0US66_9BACT|nr:MAG: hypothetical protein COU09_01480 [Candidatus Harrisonbacteria bacterium CG10_big_fil_rev_8_21_14_0_10_44_23]
MKILFDIGGTNTRLAISPNGRRIEEIIMWPTPKDYVDGFGLIRENILGLSEEKRIKSISGCLAGPLSPEKDMLIGGPNLEGWIARPIGKDLERSFRCPVNLENDAALAALGEAHYGAGKPKGIMAYITIGTGVGGARVIDGKIDKFSVGFEPGHQVIDVDRLALNTSEHGTLEELIGGRAIETRYGDKPWHLDKSEWEKFSRWLAAGLNNVMVMWSPELIVLGGSMITKKTGFTIHQLEKDLRQMLKIFPDLPKLKKSELGDLAGLYGALQVLRK